MQEASRVGGATQSKASRPPVIKEKRPKPGSLEDTRHVLWAALLRAERTLKARDHSTALKAVHALSQCATAYARVIEVSELEARIAALEGRKP